MDAQLLGAMGEAIPPLPPPAELEMLVLAAVEREGATKDESRRAPQAPVATSLPAFAGAAAVAATAVVALMSLGGGEAGSLELRTVLQAPIGPAAASVEVRETGIGRVIALESDSLPILPKGDYYELWFVAPDDRPIAPYRISAGTFHPDEDGRSRVRFTAAVDPALYPVLSVTAEPGDGDPRPTGPEVLRSAP